MNKAAEHAYQTILADGVQSKLISQMQTREELYQYLNYYEFEQKLDALFSKTAKQK
jgi:methylisocitrate lyase